MPEVPSNGAMVDLNFSSPADFMFWETYTNASKSAESASKYSSAVAPRSLRRLKGRLGSEHPLIKDTRG